MDPETFVDPALTRADLLLLKNLERDAGKKAPASGRLPPAKDGAALPPQNGDLHYRRHDSANESDTDAENDDQATIDALEAMNNPKHADFDPTVFIFWDTPDIKLPHVLDRYILQPYIRWARSAVRVETDVVMLNHLILYATTSLPSALYLFYNFSWIHGILHWVMQTYYVGTYMLMMHQHIHMRGVLAKRNPWKLIDSAFPFITDPLFGHTWNTYFYHHVRHHHIEGNGPDDLSSTIRYQRDDIWNLLHYIGRFFFLIWFDLPRYFFRKGHVKTGFRAGFSEFATFAMWYLSSLIDGRATICVFLLPFMILRMGLMVGNWGQHAFVDDVDPNSDFRSSITLIDVASNRFCFNDGYHTSHHLNPMRHWRQHPVAFLKQKDQYAREHALTFKNIDYIMITVRLVMKDYMHLAKCLVPMGEQIGMTLDEKAAMLRRKTRAFTEEEIAVKFGKQ
ncbi:putative acylamide-delta3 -desaturase protein [Neofusicoccum parvum]|uniref:Putative acylamide-delta3-desaturase protein n=1 Tax=Botryosphaeria parva (strain UCR-NP2) TaxID=1287680 RepID=R1EJF3_BOTPV|nr:putative acylamide-delta3 -desaturase protein [Neofusicoccum parvum UCRNP2]GME43028.1 putative acylamide-delta3 -desaturase protein [Neofusicoccum parvum]